MSVRIEGNLLLEVLEETPATQNIMLMGKHGIGKSQILEKFYSEKGYKVVTLFLDELNRARPEVLQTIMDLALNRKLAGRSLPAGSRIISKGNFCIKSFFK